MGLASFLKTGNPSLLFLSEDEIAEHRRTDNILDQMASERFAKGKSTLEEYQQTQARNQAGSFETLTTDPESSPWGGFKQGAAEGGAALVDSAAGAIRGTVRLFPWWLWAAGAAWFLTQSGLLARLVKR